MVIDLTFYLLKINKLTRHNDDPLPFFCSPFFSSYGLTSVNIAGFASHPQLFSYKKK